MKIVNWLLYPSKFGLWLFIGFLVAVSIPAIVFSNNTHGPEKTIAPPLTEWVEKSSTQKISDAIRTLIKTKNHPLIRDSAKRNEIAKYINQASHLYGVDPYLVVSVIYCESSFLVGVVGRRGEIGLGQQHGVAASGCQLRETQGEIYCTARWLSDCRDSCDGSDYETLTRYITGKCHSEKRGRIYRMVKYRIKLFVKAKSAEQK